MNVDVVQRWRDHRSLYRPAGEVIRTSDYDVAQIDDEATARTFVESHHYSRSYPAARRRFGLHLHGELVGVAIFSVPVQPLALACLPGGEGVELGRLVLLDAVPANAESWMLARCFESLRRDSFPGVIAFSDPMPRVGTDGEVLSPGHVGTIYQASNASYLGRSRAETLRVLPDGTVFHRRAQAKVRARECGWRYASRILVSHGAEPLGEHEDSVAWLATWLPRLTRAMRHPGNFKYAWALQRRDRRHLPPSLPYPKLKGSAN